MTPGITRALTVLCWALAVPGLLWAAVRLLGVERGPLVQLLAFTPYVAGWSLVPVALALGLRRWWPAGVAAVAAVALIGVVAPRAVGATQPVDGPRLRVLTANILGGGADMAVLAQLVREHDVDVLAVQEFTPGSAALLDAYGLAELMPYRQLNPVDSAAGSGLYSRLPITDGGVRRNDGGFTQAYATVHAPDAAPVTVESVHPAAPYSVAMVPSWRTDLNGQPRATPEGPIRVLAGDFNATLDHAPLRRLLDSGYRDAADAAGAGLTGTWGPYDGDRIPPVAIDHVLVDRRVGVRDVSVLRLPGSDHRPVLAELALPDGSGGV
ncbi:endonuclease/exonuclease/phosphatase family protein [Phytohabitans rumicis]|uniref:Endonuclease n=1 Tax=Phytohabitans rumicis TaxID=1076125 RepID=A0A6V8KVN5_9ACTN|nr:endonuclease/exonuclease/phosphatase family protein [Phytohabitans rumicis]GFJ89152.1 endonuclease [Phytohabitans rumicis]